MHCAGFHFVLIFFSFDKAGDSANAVPLTNKLRTRVIYIWDDRLGQPFRSAMERPRQRRTSLMIKVSPVPGKYAFDTSELDPKTKTHTTILWYNRKTPKKILKHNPSRRSGFHSNKKSLCLHPCPAKNITCQFQVTIKLHPVLLLLLLMLKITYELFFI